MDSDPYYRLENCPCKGCINRVRCGQDLLACKDFQTFVAYGWWRNLHRTPTRRLYNIVFGVTVEERKAAVDALMRT